jgi:5-methyltetrahydropteroyltriglutamate--homocysteine methyltransferase
MAPRATPPFRADHVGSLLRPPELLRARDEGAANLREVEDEAIRACGPDAGGDRPAGCDRRRVPPGVLAHGLHLPARRRHPHPGGAITVHFHGDEGDLDAVFSGMHVDGKLGLERTIFGDDFVFLRDTVTTAVPKLTIPRRAWSTTAAAGVDRPSVYPELDRSGPT